MADETERIDEALNKILVHLEDGSGDFASARALADAMHSADLTPAEDLTEVLLWQEKNWWADDAHVDLRRAISEELEHWSQLWRRHTGFVAYRAAAIRQALNHQRPGQPRQSLPATAQDFIEAELSNVVSSVSETWIQETISQLRPALDPDRSVYLETVCVAALRQKNEGTIFPEELLQSIIHTNTEATDRAFDTWLTVFGPTTSEVWKALRGMERERWTDIAKNVGGFVAQLSKPKATAFVRRLALSSDSHVVSLLEEVDPASVTQSSLANVQTKLLAEASNSKARRTALERIQALGLTTYASRAQLADQVFKTAAQSDSAARDVFSLFPSCLKEAPGVKARWKSLKKKVSPSLKDRAEKFGRKFLGL